MRRSEGEQDEGAPRVLIMKKDKGETRNLTILGS